MFNFLVTKFGLGNAVRDLSSCFYDKYSNIESTVCTPFTVSRTGPVTGEWGSAYVTILYHRLTDLRGSILHSLPGL